MDAAVKDTFRRAAIWIGIAAGAFVLWEVREAVLLAFGGIMLAILLRMIASAICRVTPLSDAWGLAVATLLIVILFFLCIWLFSMNLGNQFHDVVKQARTGIQQLQSMLNSNGFDGSVLSKGTSFIGTMIPNVLKTSLRFLEAAVIVAVMAIYLAAQPDMYRRGAALLFPQRLRPKAMEALNLIGSSLRLWMLAQLILMAVVGILSYVAVLVLGLPNPGALGLIAGITELVPYLGPFIGGAPAVLVALTKNTMLAVYTILAYVGVHVVEGYLVGPLLQRWFVLIPPALVLTGIFASQLLFGFAGVILAAPVTVAVFAAVKVLYMRDTLKQDVEMPENPPI